MAMRGAACDEEAHAQAWVRAERELRLPAARQVGGVLKDTGPIGPLLHEDQILRSHAAEQVKGRGDQPINAQLRIQPESLDLLWPGRIAHGLQVSLQEGP